MWILFRKVRIDIKHGWIPCLVTFHNIYELYIQMVNSQSSHRPDLAVPGEQSHTTSQWCTKYMDVQCIQKNCISVWLQTNRQVAVAVYVYILFMFMIWFCWLYILAFCENTIAFACKQVSAEVSTVHLHWWPIPIWETCWCSKENI